MSHFSHAFLQNVGAVSTQAAGSAAKGRADAEQEETWKNERGARLHPSLAVRARVAGRN